MIGCRWPSGSCLPGERHVDDVLGQRAVELGALELRLAGRDRLLDRLARGVQGHARLAVAHLAERELEVARAAEVADAQLLELVGGRGSLDRAQGLALERLRVHARDCIAWLSHGLDSLAEDPPRASAGPRREAEAR